MADKPFINMKHIDGPMLACRDHSVRWLTYWERLLLWLGLTDANRLDKTKEPSHDR